MNRDKEASKKFFTVLFKLIALLVFFVAVFSLIKWLMERAQPNVQPEPSAGANQPMSVTKASFTELFSGTGWKNEAKSTAYQDIKTTVISLPPAYDFEEVPALGDSLKNETIIAAKGNGKEVVLVAKSGKIFKFQNGAGPVRQVGQTASSSLNNALLDYNDSSGVWVVAAFSGNGIEAGPVNKISSIKAAGALSGLACSGGECLLVAGSAIYHFSINNPSALNKINPPFAASGTEPSGNFFEPFSPGKAKNILIVGGVKKEGNAYTGDIFKYSAGSLSSMTGNQPLFSSSYPGTIRFGYNPENGKILAVYAAYIGQAKILEISNSEFKIAGNYSNFFPQRVMEGMAAGEVRFDPELFSKNGVWWLGSSAQSPVQKIARIEGGVLSDFGDKISSSLSSLGMISVSSIFAVPGFGEKQIYAVVVAQDATKIFKITDLGFETGNNVVWESSNINQWNKELVSGAVFRIDADENGGKLNYFLSADGGQSWLPAKQGETVEFKKGILSGSAGNDFRYKIEISPASSQFQTPWVDTIGVEYSVKPAQ